LKTLDGIMDEATRMDSQMFLRLVGEVDQLLSMEERGSGKFQITGRLVSMLPLGEATIIGDIHGDLDSLRHILDRERFVQKASSNRGTYLVFLGDYGDRGSYSPEVYYVVLSLKSMFPERVVLLQGNHEGPEDLLAYPHDLPYHLQRKFGGDWRAVYMELSRLFRRFYTAVLVDERCIMLHAGVPSKARSLEDVVYAHEKHPAESHLEEILWSDPSDEITGTRPSSRGAGYLFGEDVTDAFLKMVGVRFVIRGHEPISEGYKINHAGRILTLFSRKGSPYFNRHGAYLTLDLSKAYDSAEQIEPFVRQL